MAVPLIDFGVIKKGSLSPCLTKKSSELRRAARVGNAASEPLQNPAFPMTQISSALSHTDYFANQQAGTREMCKLRSSETFPFANPSRLCPGQRLNKQTASLACCTATRPQAIGEPVWYSRRFFWRKSFYCSGRDYLQLLEALKIQLPLLNFGISKC